MKKLLILTVGSVFLVFVIIIGIYGVSPYVLNPIVRATEIIIPCIQGTEEDKTTCTRDSSTGRNTHWVDFEATDTVVYYQLEVQILPLEASQNYNAIYFLQNDEQKEFVSYDTTTKTFAISRNDLVVSVVINTTDGSGIKAEFDLRTFNW